MFNNNNGRLIDNVKVKKCELLEVLNKNLVNHIEDVLDALSLRRSEMKEYFANTLLRMDKDDNYDAKENINFAKPIDSSDDYRKAIRMVEMTQDEIIELSEDQFDKLVMDNWDWKQALTMTSAMYGKTI